jgi:hypothetical protein
MGGEPMGGEPMMEAPMEEEDDLPFSTDELVTEDKMYEGGYMRGYAAAGLVEATPGVVGGSTQADLNFGGQGSMEFITYYGPNGEEVTIPFYNGNPTQVVPSGYTRTKPVVASTPAPTPTDGGFDTSEMLFQAPTAQESADRTFKERFSTTDYSTRESLTLSIQDQIDALNKTRGSMLERAIPGFTIAEKLNRTGQHAAINTNIAILRMSGDEAGAKALEKMLADKVKAEDMDFEFAGMTLGSGKQWARTATGEYGWVNPANIKPAGTVTKGKTNGAVSDAIDSTPAPVVGGDPSASKRSSSDNINMAQANANKNTQSVVDKAVSKGATEQEVKTIKSEGAKVKAKLDDMNSGKNTTGKVGFAKGGLMTKK